MRGISPFTTPTILVPHQPFPKSPPLFFPIRAPRCEACLVVESPPLFFSIRPLPAAPSTLSKGPGERELLGRGLFGVDQIFGDDRILGDISRFPFPPEGQRL